MNSKMWVSHWLWLISCHMNKIRKYYVSYYLVYYRPMNKKLPLVPHFQGTPARLLSIRVHYMKHMGWEHFSSTLHDI